LYVIDHSLRSSGDHHYDLMWSLASASQANGLRTVIGTHASFQESIPGIPAHAIRRRFRDTMYQPMSRIAGLRKMTRSVSSGASSPSNTSPASRGQSSPWRRIWQQLRNGWSQRRCHAQTHRFVQRFGQDCERFFENESLQEGDHVCFATVSELELAGLAQFLKRSPDSHNAQWHLWFHFPLLAGRPPEYQRQTKLVEELREFFIHHLRTISCHRLHFYCTTESLAEQYNRLGLVRFQALPYPLSPHFWTPMASSATTATSIDPLSLKLTAQLTAPLTPTPSNQCGAKAPLPQAHRDITPGPWGANRQTDPSQPGAHVSTSNQDYVSAVLQRLRSLPTESNHTWHGPLRLSSMGAVRREKQQQHWLQPLIQQTWQPWLSTGKLQLQVQQPQRRWPARQKLQWHPPAGASVADVQTSLINLPHPLPAAEYRRQLEQADCGLLLYDGDTYYARRAGILGEFLALGKPVIVSAGSWLHEQIKDVQFAYHESLLEHHPPVNSYSWEQLSWDAHNIPLPGGVIAFDHEAHPFELEIPLQPDECGVIVKFLWHCPNSAGVYCRIQPLLPGTVMLDQTSEQPRSTGFTRQSDEPGAANFREMTGRVRPTASVYPAGRDAAFESVTEPTIAANATSARPKPHTNEIDDGETRGRDLLTQIVGHRSGGGESTVFIRIPQHQGRLTLRLTNAFHDSSASITGVTVHTLPESCLSSPLGAVGIAVAGEDQLGNAVSEWMQYHEHYRATAAAFGQVWREHNRPDRVIAALLRTAKPLARAA
jgi:hypothetical protein